ncbi:MAG: amino acid adenylation domain-containing protein [Kiritimatiellae bacterium]|nr:amino acid adenylation domain-containing protein [Kiritimatiellia bacterium]
MLKRAEACFVGRGTLLIRCAEEWRAAGHELAAIFSSDIAVLAWAAQMGVVTNPTHVGATDYLFAVGLSLETTGSYPVKVKKLAVAFQDSLLPTYSGWHATTWALLNRETTHGVTWYALSAGVVQVLQRVEFSVAPDERAHSLDAKCFDAGLSSFRNLVPLLHQEPLPVLPALALKPSFFPETRRPEGGGILDFSRSTDEVLATVHALDYGDRLNPVARAKVWIGDTVLAIGTAASADNPMRAAAGSIVRADPSALVIATADGAVSLGGLTSLDGVPLDKDAQLFSEVVAGAHRASQLSAESARAVAAAHEELATAEDEWARRLEALEPFNWPFATTAGVGPRAFVSEEIAARGLPDSPDERAASIASFFARISGADAIDIGWSCEGSNASAPLTLLLAPVVPLNVRLSATEKWPAFAESFTRELSELRKRKTYPRDLLLRDPRLQGVGVVRYPVCLVPEGAASDDVDADLVVSLGDGARAMVWRYDANRVSAERIAQLKTLFVGWLEVISRDANTPLRHCDLKGAESAIEGPVLEYPHERDLTAWVDAAAEKSPDAPAIIFESRVISYRELVTQSNRMAAYLRARGVGADVRVGLLLERTPESLIALLGILKAGGCYVPIDPHFPSDRIAYMMEQASLALVLTQAEFRPRIPAGREALLLDREWTALRDQPAESLACGATADHLLYVIYTSGSTGRPKGVAMTRRAGMNLVAWQNTQSTPNPSGRTFQYASFGFDVSFQEIFSTWSAGGALVVVPEAMRRDPMHLLRLAREQEVDRWFMPYAALQQVALSAAAAEVYPEALRNVITAGETLRVTPEIGRFFERLSTCRLHNQYGPSETHVATACELPRDPRTWPALPAIGTPIANTNILLLDPAGLPVPTGFSGELFIGGDCLARGYWDQPELTSERFIESEWKGKRERFYRTGDLARLDAEGALEFLGRGDDQVKIRGYRVELGEVEAALSKHPSVRECAVVAREQGALRQLVAYVVTTGSPIEGTALRGYLQASLPEYMVPGVYLFLDRIPLTPSGKIHRRALPAPPTTRGEGSDLPPRTEIERVLAQLWQQALGIERVSVGANFFDLGGDSLKLARVQAGLRTALGREVSILDLFRFPTISSVASYLTQGEEAAAMVSRARRVDSSEPIAVVGMAGRFPGAASVEYLWKNLCENRESITFFSDGDVQGGPPPGSELKFIKARGVLEECEWFDAALFGYGPRESELMDPQHRVFLESAVEALENAGCDPERTSAAIGVFAACSLNTYLIFNALKDRAAVEDFARAFQVAGYQTLMGNDKDYIATRVAYKLNLHGPSLTIQSACSSSLVALCQACESLQSGTCDIALAGGASISFPQKRGYFFVEGSIASSDGHCRPFDASATGTVFGAGAAVVVLKRLSDAQANGDTIYGVVKGWGLNNDGARKAGYMAPSAEGQADAIRMALDRADIDPRTVGFVETHGTGTPLGDPIEVTGLTRAFRQNTADSGFCALGSVKANIGHLEAAAGVTGFIKAVLSLHHRQIPPLLHFERPNPLLDLANTPFYCPRELSAWPESDSPRRAGVSSFGVGGTNAHVVLEEAPQSPRQRAERSCYLLPLSARTDTALSAAATKLANFLEKQEEISLADVAYTLDTGRRRMAKRGFVVARDSSDAISALRSGASFRRGEPMAGKPSVVFLFPGQGSQHEGMGRELYANEPVFREHFDACADVLRPLLNIELREFLFTSENQQAEREKELTQTQFAQPCIFAIEYALARWWMSLGVRPAAFIGHSSGEFVAACLEGVFSLEDALKLVVQRGALMQEQKPGRMLAVRLPEADVQLLLPEALSIAGCNAPALTVVSGPTEAIELFARELEEKKIGSKVLQTSHAFHSAMMEPALDRFRQAVAETPRKPASGKFLSTLTGGWVSAEAIAEPEYWAQQMRHAVRFSAALREAMKLPNALFLEVGPSQALTTLVLQHDDPAAPLVAVPSMRHAKEGVADDVVLMRAAGRLWASGVEWDSASLFGSPLPQRIALPTYPFERKRFWIEPPASDGSVPRSASSDLASESVSDTSEPSDSIEAAAASRDVHGEVLEILQELSGIEKADIDPARPFLEMGFDSLFLTQVSLAFQRRFLVKLTLRQMLDDLSSPAAIAAYLAEHMPAKPTTPAARATTPSAPSIATRESEVSNANTLSVTQSGPFAPEEEAETKPAPPVLTRHGPYAPINTSAGDALTPKQQEHLQALIARYTRKTQRSKEYTRQHRSHFADPRAVAGFRITWKELTYPIVASRSAGSKIWDLDGNEFLDVTMGFGTNLFGHNPDFIRVELEKQLATGIEIGPQSALAGEIAQAVVSLTGMERATFCNTGSEAVMGAVRAARTVTGKQRIVYFSGDYHGVNDEALAKGQLFRGKQRTVPIAPGIPQDMVNHVTVLTYGDPASLDAIRAEAHDLAAVLVEPVQSRKPQLQPREFLHALRTLTRELGIALIFDEVITGFRVHPGGAQAWFGVHADLATYGKVIGGGMPIGVVAGRREYMDAFDGGAWNYGDDSVPEAGVTFFAGTFVRHPLAMAAARAVVNHLQDAGPALQSELNERTARFVKTVNEFMAAEGVDLMINNFGSLWYFSHGDSFKHFSLLFHFLRDQGIHIWEGRPCFLSTAHTEADVARLIEAFRQAIAEMRAGDFLPERTHEIPEVGPFALTPGQQEIWLASRLDATASPAFNESCSFTFRGPFNRAAMELSLQELVARHESLRTVFDESGELQRVHESAAMDVQFLDLAPLEATERERQLEGLIRAEVSHAFDLAHLPLARARLIRMASDLHVMVLTVHHIVCDGWSYDVMARDLSELYSAACRHTPDARPLPNQFRAYARYMDGYRRDARMEADRRYWLETLAAPPSALEWPLERARPAQRTFNGTMDVFTIEEPMVSAIKELGSKQRATLFANLLAHHAALLYRLTGQTDLIVGVPAAGQQLMEDGALVGHCANLLPVRLKVDPDMPFSELMAAAQRALLNAYEHQGLTFGELVKMLQLPRDPTRPPLIQSTFNVDPAIHGMTFGDLETEVVINPRAAYQFEFSLNVVAHPDRLRIECNYNTDLFDSATIARWMGHFRQIVRTATDEPHTPLGAIPLLTDDERRTVLFDWNNTRTSYPSTCIHELFEEQVEVAPDRIALSFAGETLTYGELNARANRLARALLRHGVGPNQAVGLCADRSIEMVVALLAILKAGGAYMPLDPTHPTERLMLQIGDAETRVVVVAQPHAHLFAGAGVQVVVLDDPAASWQALPDSALTAAEISVAHSPNQLAYILFTSGSTGRPKGVLIEHKSVVRLVRGVTYASLGAEERFLHLSPLAFDASTFELWAPLLNGARLAILAPGPFSIELLARTLASENISVLWLTAGLFHVVVDENPMCLAPVKQLLTGGEAPSGRRIARLLAQRPDLTVINGYGPTESTTFATTEAMTSASTISDPPPLGHPIANTQVYVLDTRLQPQPIGVAGELFIGGDGLARGYLNRPELTQEAFIPNPLSGTPGDRLYRTGDLARWRADGRLEFLGRRDDQVKIRGFRIEPGEIEAVLAGYPGLQNSAVIVRTAPNEEKQLVAYLAPAAQGQRPDSEAVRAHLRLHMPEFMIPSQFVVQQNLPLNASGKVDRRALAALPLEQPETPRVSPALSGNSTSAREALIADIWKQILGVSRVGRTDDFFALGGHSLAALKLINRLSDAGFDLEVAELFRNSTVERLAAALKPRNVEVAAPVIASQGDALVRLRDGQAGHPLLCLLPSDFGDLLIYANLLTHLDDRIPVVGLQCPTMYENDRGLRSMEDLAAWFVRDLRAVQPHGPYYLAGYCFGGLLAMEMARQLTAAGESIGLLGLIDARPFSPKTESSEYLRMRLHGALRAKPRDWKRHIAAKLAMRNEARLIDALARKSPDKLEKRDLNRWVLETRVLQSYHSSDYAGPIVFFYPEESRFELYGDPSCGWLNLADRVFLHKVPGSHLNMMQDPHVLVLAERLNALVRRAVGRGVS